MTAILTNSRKQYQNRTIPARISWAGPLSMLAARTLFVIIAQAFVTLIFAWQGNPDPLRAGTAWWQVTGTLVDLGCLALLYRFTRREGIRLWDLIGLDKSKLVRDVLLGVGILLVVFPIVMIGGSLLSGLLVFGTIQPSLPGEVMVKHLPLWAILYSRMMWWLLWSVTEEMTYNGYALPRLQTLTRGRTWIAMSIVGIFWSIQHAFLPFIPEWRVFVYLFIQMLPLVTVMQLLYLRYRRLPPLIVMHWGMDLFSAIAMSSMH
jgi:uncharacterized protein